MEIAPRGDRGLLDPTDVQVHDVTLRDGEQQAGVEFTSDDKVRIATALAEAGIHRIEAGLPAVSPSDADAIKRMVAEGLAHRDLRLQPVHGPRRRARTGLRGQRSRDGGAGQPPPHREGLPLAGGEGDRGLGRGHQDAHDNGLKVTFFPIDATRATMTELLDDLEQVATEGHVDNIALVDTFGVTSPHAIRYYTQRVRERMAVPLETHFHMDFGMGVANTASPSPKAHR